MAGVGAELQNQWIFPSVKIRASLKERPLLGWICNRSWECSFQQPKCTTWSKNQFICCGVEGLGAPSRVSGSIWKHPFCMSVTALTSVSENKLCVFCGWKGFRPGLRPRNAAVGYPWRSQAKAALCTLAEFCAKAEAVGRGIPSRSWGVIKHTVLMFPEVSCRAV